MNEATIVGVVLIALGTITSIYKGFTEPVINLTKQLTIFSKDISKLSENQTAIKEDINDFKLKNTDSHGRIHQRINDVDKKADENRERVIKIETKIGL